jgi:scyllo-inositol 2-dehydrogenase (NADP+)
MTGKLRVGLIGFGLAGRVFHGSLLAADPRFDVAAIVTGDPQRQADARLRHPSADVVGSAEALLQRADDLDLVVIASPPTTHVPLARAAVDAGLAVVVDKPLCAASAEADDLVAYAATAGLLLTVFQNRRWDSDFLTLKREIAAGTLGEVRQLESRFERWKAPGPDVSKPWRSEAPREAGGIVYDLGSHLVDQAIQLLGPVDDVHAEITSYGGTAGPDDGFLSLRHAGGRVSRLWMSSVAGQVGPRFRVLGSAGAFLSWGLDVQESQLAAGVSPTDPAYGRPPEEQWPIVGAGESAAPVPPERGDYPAFYSGVADALTSGSAMPVDPRDSAEVVRILEEAHRGFVGGPL